MKKTSNKLQFAIHWLTDHPADLFVTGRVLERRIQMGMQTVSYKTWNEAKRLLNTPTFNDLETLEERHTVIINTRELTITHQGANTRVVYKRMMESLNRSYHLLLRAGYEVSSKPVAGVYILTKPQARVIQLFERKTA
jgi:hypothetical protein